MLGEPGWLQLRERANRREIPAPSMVLAGPPLGGPVTGSPVASPEDAAARVRAQAAEGL